MSWRSNQTLKCEGTGPFLSLRSAAWEGLSNPWASLAESGISRLLSAVHGFEFELIHYRVEGDCIAV